MIQIRPPKRRVRCRDTMTTRAPRVLDEHPTSADRNEPQRNVTPQRDGVDSARKSGVSPSTWQTDEKIKPSASAPILVVDDDLSILATIREVLELEGHAVEVARNGAEALDSISRSWPSLVLLDMRMPVLDGWGFAQQLRARGVTIPVVVMTAAHNARAWAEEIGADAYLAKPFDLIELLTVVERCRRDPSTDSHPNS